MQNESMLRQIVDTKNTETSLVNLIIDTPVLIRSFLDFMFPQSNPYQMIVPKGEFALMIASAALQRGQQNIVRIDESGLHGTIPNNMSGISFAVGVLGNDLDPTKEWKKMSEILSLDVKTVKNFQIRCVTDIRTYRPPSGRSLEETQFVEVFSLNSQKNLQKA